MTRQQDFDDQAVHERYRALHQRRAARVEAAEQDDDGVWTLHAALFGALVVALLFSTFL